jgi:hypothetical protein
VCQEQQEGTQHVATHRSFRLGSNEPDDEVVREEREQHHEAVHPCLLGVPDVERRDGQQRRSERGHAPIEQLLADLEQHGDGSHAEDEGGEADARHSDPEQFRPVVEEDVVERSHELRVGGESADDVAWTRSGIENRVHLVDPDTLVCQLKEPQGEPHHQDRDETGVPRLSPHSKFDQATQR